MKNFPNTLDGFPLIFPMDDNLAALTFSQIKRLAHSNPTNTHSRTHECADIARARTISSCGGGKSLEWHLRVQKKNSVFLNCFIHFYSFISLNNWSPPQNNRTNESFTCLNDSFERAKLNEKNSLTRNFSRIYTSVIYFPLWSNCWKVKKYFLITL